MPCDAIADSYAAAAAAVVVTGIKTCTLLLSIYLHFPPSLLKNCEPQQEGGGERFSPIHVCAGLSEGGEGKVYICIQVGKTGARRTGSCANKSQSLRIR